MPTPDSQPDMIIRTVTLKVNALGVEDDLDRWVLAIQANAEEADGEVYVGTVDLNYTDDET